MVDEDGTFEEGPVRIMDGQDQLLLCKTVRLVKVLWQHQGVEEAIWEHEDTLRANYYFSFEDEGIASCLLVCLILFLSVGITVVQHCNTVGIHRSFP